MKILILTKHFNLGGITRYIFDLTKGLIKNGHTVYIASSGGELVDEIESLGAIHVTIPIDTKSELSLKIYKSLFKLTSYFKDKKIDLIHAHTRVTSVLGYFVSKKLKIQYITTVHGLYKNRLNRRLFPFLGRTAIAVSNQTKDRLVNWFNIKPERIKLIYNGLDIEKFSSYSGDKAYLRQKIEFKKDDFVIGNVSRLAKIKGQHLLIKAFKSIVSKIENARLLLVGDGKYRGELKKLVISQGLEGKVVFTGALKDVRPMLSIMDVFCFTPFDEPFGIALLEAMVMGLPIVASSVSQIPHILDNGNCGILVKSGDIKAIEKSVCMLYNDGSLRNHLIENELKRVHNKYSIDRVVEKVEKIYRHQLA